MSDFINYTPDNGSGDEEESESRLGEIAGKAKELAGNAKDKLGSAAGGVADRVRGAGRYVRETDARGMATDAGEFVRRYPVQSLLVGVGLGYLVGRIRRS